MPEAFFTIFDPILDEEARHMVFFVNWIAYKQVHAGKSWQRPLHSLWQYTSALQRRLDNLGSMGKPSGSGKGKTKKGFTATGAKSFMAGLTLEKFLAACLEENAKRMSAYDERLLRPDFLPIMAQLGCSTLKLLPKRKPDAIADAT